MNWIQWKMINYGTSPKIEGQVQNTTISLQECVLKEKKVVSEELLWSSLYSSCQSKLLFIEED